MNEIDVMGERVMPRADRTLYWPARRTLLLADPHFGKAEAFRAASVPVPGDAVATLSRLSQALLDTHAERLVVLGDFWHSRAGCQDAVQDCLNIWRTQHSTLQIELIRGNHDRAGPPPSTWAAAWHRHLTDAPFLCAHHPEPHDGGYVLAGHLHPGYRLTGRGRQTLKLPCFWFGDRVGVLPAFGNFTGLAIVEPAAADRCVLIAGEHLILKTA
jgi:DNA ligase-associated metallophosphoesterase